jgi:hypothetical protein
VRRGKRLSRQKEYEMRMVWRIALYIGLALLAVFVGAGVAYAAFRMGVPSTLAPWVGLGAFLVCAGVIVYFMEFQRS